MHTVRALPKKSAQTKPWILCQSLEEWSPLGLILKVGHLTATNQRRTQFPTLFIGMKSWQPRVNSVRGFEVLTKQGNGHAMHHRQAYARHWFAKRGHLAVRPSFDLAPKPPYVECWTHKEWSWQNDKTFDLAIFNSCRTFFWANKKLANCLRLYTCPRMNSWWGRFLYVKSKIDACPLRAWMLYLPGQFAARIRRQSTDKPGPLTRNMLLLTGQ